MTRLQKVIIIIYLIVFAVAVAYVPWECYYKVIYLNSYGGYSLDKEGISRVYYFFWKIPSLENKIPHGDIEDVVVYKATVEFWKIPLELLIITVVFAALFVLTLRPKKD